MGFQAEQRARDLDQLEQCNQELQARCRQAEQERVALYADWGSERWYVRRSDGSVTGPVGVAKLHEWPARGNIGPFDELSPDNRVWVGARRVPELKLNWLCRADGA